MNANKEAVLKYINKKQDTRLDKRELGEMVSKLNELQKELDTMKIRKEYTIQDAIRELEKETESMEAPVVDKAEETIKKIHDALKLY